MFLIMSGAYVSNELSSIFGKLPPAFLPLGNSRLFKHQINLITDNNIYLSLPETFCIESSDLVWLSDNKINLIYTDESTSIGESVVKILSNIESAHLNTLNILFGDTLISKIPEERDVVTTSDIKDNYKWAVVRNEEIMWANSDDEVNENYEAVCGYFSFSQPLFLINAIKKTEYDFIKALNIYKKSIGLTVRKTQEWLDFGHVNTFYRSKTRFCTQRVFNELKISSRYIEKTSNNQIKIKAEANWYELIPYSMRIYLPQYLGSEVNKGKFYYRLEYLCLPSLSELFVFSKLSYITWKYIILRCLEFIDSCLIHKCDKSQSASSLNDLLITKTTQRLQQYCQDGRLSLNTPWVFNNSFKITLQELLNAANNNLPKNKISMSVVHGDFCFSNIFYDFSADKVKTVDPRGLTHKHEFTIYGDIRYDIAKLSHSVLGMYDYIIAENYVLIEKDQNLNFQLPEVQAHTKLQKYYIDLIQSRYELTVSNLYAMQIHLFISMLPLHADNHKRQKAFIANAIRLYQLMRISNDSYTHGRVELALS